MKAFQPARREFLGKVGEGMLVAAIGPGLASSLGVSLAHADDDASPKPLDFGALEPLVAAMQETSIDRFIPFLVNKLNSGETNLTQLIQAGALANARSFGGEDYIGFHTLMALKPAFAMAEQLPDDLRPLAVLKVLYRNTAQIQAKGGRSEERLHHVEPSEISPERNPAELLREAVHSQDWKTAEGIFAAISQTGPQHAWNDLLHTVEDGADVHRIVLAHRAWDTLDLIGMDHAETMLRQSLRYCLKQENWSAKHDNTLRTLLPRLLDEHNLVDHPIGERRAEDKWVDEKSQTIFRSTPEQAAAAVAESLAEGFSPASIAEAISLATNQLVLRDEGRTGKQVRPGKPEGSVHGDSIGVHASDSSNAWRHIAEVSEPNHTIACLILSGFQAARDRVDRGGNFLEWKPRPYEEQMARIDTKDPERLLKNLDGAIREQDQAMACALMQAYGDGDNDVRPALDVLLRHALSEDGALHAEKYYVTTTTDFADSRPAFRWRHLVGLARVTASEYGTPAPGYEEACDLLGIQA